MGCDVPVGNGNLLIDFDSQYNIRDIYYPHVGKANHSRKGISRTGIWVNGEFSWLSSSQWDKKIGYASDTLATEVVAVNKELGLQLVFTDVVDFHRDVFLRRINVLNLTNKTLKIRLFFHYDFYFWDVGRGDSIQYDSFQEALVAYKDDCYFLMNASWGEAVGITGWSTGHKDELGAGGCWTDAEDGVLERISVSFGSVDGIISVESPSIPPGESSDAYTWLAAARNPEDVRILNFEVCRRGPQVLITRTMNYWRAWVNKEDENFCELSEEVVHQYKRSLLVLRTQIDNGGGIIASSDGSLSELVHGMESYAYVWPRDGALIASALDKAGYAFIANAFYDFCKDVINIGSTQYQDVFQEKSYMLHKYTPDRLVGASWIPMVDEEGKQQLPIQEDETAVIPYVLWQHYLKFRDIEAIKPLFRSLVIETANFMVDHREKNTGLPAPSFDLWEEGSGIYSYTVAAVWAGLTAAANFADLFGELEDATRYRSAAAQIKQACVSHLYDSTEGRFLKGVSVQEDGKKKYDFSVDASLYGLWYFGMFEPDDPRIKRTMQAVLDKLTCQTPIGGIARYEGDQYYWDTALEVDRKKVPGNPWFICTLWTAQYRIATAKTLEELKSAEEILKWVCEKALPSGVMAEQIHPLTGEPRSVSPLTWSHATYVAAVHEFLEKYQSLQQGTSNAA